jgi:hypothetical protein
MSDPLRQKITDRLDKLQSLMEDNKHLKNPDDAYNLTLRVSVFWSILSEEDRDYIQCAQHAIEEGLEWNV